MAETRGRSLGSDVELVTERARFDSLAGAWDAVATDADTPFGLHGWVGAWLDAFDAGRPLRIPVLWEGGRIAAALPLVADRRRRWSATANVHTPVLQPLAAEPAALATLLAAVARRRVEIVLPKLPVGAAVGCLLGGTGRRTLLDGRHVAFAHEPGGSFEEWSSSLGKRGAELRRRRRRLERNHDVGLDALARPARLEYELEEGLRLEASGWKGRAGTAILSTPETERFYRAVAGVLAARDELRVARLELDGRLVAWQLNVLHAGRLHGLKGGFDEAERRSAPGLLLVHATIERAYREGLRSVEMGMGSEAYKRELGNRVRELATLRSYPDHPAPLTRFAYRRAVRPTLRRAVLALRNRNH